MVKTTPSSNKVMNPMIRSIILSQDTKLKLRNDDKKIKSRLAENLTHMCLNHGANQHKLNFRLRNGFRTINASKRPISQKRQSIQNDLVTAEYPATSNAEVKPPLFLRSIKWTVRL